MHQDEADAVTPYGDRARRADIGVRGFPDQVGRVFFISTASISRFEVLLIAHPRDYANGE